MTAAINFWCNISWRIYADDGCEISSAINEGKTLRLGKLWDYPGVVTRTRYFHLGI
jgi:hypothetical protein